METIFFLGLSSSNEYCVIDNLRSFFLFPVRKVPIQEKMYMSNEDVTSKYNKKLVVDFQLADCVGRDSTMDPFANKDITKILGKPQRDRMSLLDNVKKPARHSPSLVDIVHEEDRGKKGFPQMTSISPGPIYDVPSTLSDASRTIGSATRWPQDRPHTVQESKREAMKALRTSQLTESLKITQPPASFVSWDTSAPKLALFSGRESASTLPVPRTVDRFTVFHWEQKKRLEKQAVDLTAGEIQRSKPPTPSDHATETSNVDDKWTREHKSLLSRMGIAGTTRRDTQKRRHNVHGPDFAATVGRDAPCSFHTKITTTDVTYDATRPPTRSTGTVSFKSFSGRATSAKPFVETAQRCIEYNSLARFHERQKIRARTSPFALPDQPNESAAEDDRRVYDDLTMHPESLKQPVLVNTKKFHGAPDIALFSDRADSTLADVLGPNAKKYLQRSNARMGENNKKTKKNQEHSEVPDM